MKIGVLALQGDFGLHIRRLRELSAEAVEVRNTRELAACQGLILPGGESTTLVKLLNAAGLFEEIKAFGKQHPIFGTCAGTILLGAEVRNHPVEHFNLIDIVVERNAYGRQIDSFVDRIEVHQNGSVRSVEGVFIRAPRIIRVGPSVDVLATHGESCVLAENRMILAATFHPELSEDPFIHQYFLEKVRRSV